MKVIGGVENVEIVVIVFSLILKALDIDDDGGDGWGDQHSPQHLKHVGVVTQWLRLGIERVEITLLIGEWSR